MTEQEEVVVGDAVVEETVTVEATDEVEEGEEGADAE